MIVLVSPNPAGFNAEFWPMTNDPSGIPWQLFLHQKKPFHLPTNNSKALFTFFYTTTPMEVTVWLCIFLLHLELLHHELTPQALSFIVVFARHLSCILKRDENQLLWLMFYQWLFSLAKILPGLHYARRVFAEWQASFSNTFISIVHCITASLSLKNITTS